VVLHLNVCHMHLPRPSRVDPQVGWKLPRWPFEESELQLFFFRIYAVTLGNIPVTVVFGFITFSELALGTLGTVSRAGKGGEVIHILMVEQSSSSGSRSRSSLVIYTHTAQPFPPVPLDPYHICLFIQHRTHDVGYASLSLLYGAPRSSQT
jgi:hypothetical protein